jgi:hypothetical protein
MERYPIFSSIYQQMQNFANFDEASRPSMEEEQWDSWLSISGNSGIAPLMHEMHIIAPKAINLDVRCILR